MRPDSGNDLFTAGSTKIFLAVHSKMFIGRQCMTRVQFYDQAEDQKLRFAVIVTKTNGRWVFCKHRERDTLEVPGATGNRGKRSWIRRSGN